DYYCSSYSSSTTFIF
nr:immunoglobulin light chain junction region [Macaca mulatta]MOV96508.1 immunoglobulin light chain junction region [Macaca mulatta]MOV98701.1 immunoglobulin light chain junction region [Macaca mulatta]MOW00752.1 immunoglobulin light chain junction region [Macaca mulatta]